MIKLVEPKNHYEKIATTTLVAKKKKKAVRNFRIVLDQSLVAEAIGVLRLAVPRQAFF